MTRKQVELKAKQLGVVNIARQKKEDLIRSVQRAEGNNECYRRIEDCRVDDCLWRTDCQ